MQHDPVGDLHIMAPSIPTPFPTQFSQYSVTLCSSYVSGVTCSDTSVPDQRNQTFCGNGIVDAGMRACVCLSFHLPGSTRSVLVPTSFPKLLFKEVRRYKEGRFWQVRLCLNCPASSSFCFIGASLHHFMTSFLGCQRTQCLWKFSHACSCAPVLFAHPIVEHRHCH